MIVKRTAHCFFEIKNLSMEEAVKKCTTDVVNKLVDVARLLYVEERFKDGTLSGKEVKDLFNVLGRKITYNDKSVEFELDLDPALILNDFNRKEELIKENAKRKINSKSDTRFDSIGAVKKLNDGINYDTTSDYCVIVFLREFVPKLERVEDDGEPYATEERLNVLLNIFRDSVVFKIVRIGNRQYYFYEIA